MLLQYYYKNQKRMVKRANKATGQTQNITRRVGHQYKKILKEWAYIKPE